MSKDSISIPLVSIITVVYNGEQHLRQTIESVINQTYKNAEYIIIDGGSTDGTVNLIKEYSNHISHWISEPDKGLYDAMNKGIKIASGELIGMINSDDWYELDAIEVIVDAYLKHTDKDIFHADRYDIDQQGYQKIRKFNPSKYKLMYYDMTYNHPSMFVTRREYLKHLYNTELEVISDYQFTLEAFLDNPNKFHYIEKPIVSYRLDGISAQISLINSSKEFFLAKRNAGMNIIENILSVAFRLVYLFMKQLIK